MSAGPIFETVSRQGVCVAVALEVGKRGGLVLTVRELNGTLVLASPVAHCDSELLSIYLDSVDVTAILSRIAEND
jgi:hypothetical protein